MGELLGLCVLAALLGTGGAISCYNCTSSEGYNCTTNQATCTSAVNSCITIARDEEQGSALQCEVCESKAKSCSGPLQPCAPSEGTCVIAVAEFNLGANSFSYTAKSCLEPENCEPGPFTLTYAHNITVRVNIACCDIDGCNAGAIPGCQP